MDLIMERMYHPRAMATIRDLLEKTKPWLAKLGVEEARLDAELLVAHALGVKRLDLFLDLDRPLTEAEVTRARELVARRGKREPVAHIVGTREFYGLAFEVNADVLVPRPDTETLVEIALREIGADVEGTFVDVCTGSGCVAIAILANRPKLRAIATDLSDRALAVAARNAARLGVSERLSLREGDLLAPCAGETVQFVVANPPYVTAQELAEVAPEVRDFEPRMALLGESDDGLGHHRRILEQARALVADGGFCAMEIGFAQGDGARAIRVDGWSAPTVERDLSRTDRVMVSRRQDRPANDRGTADATR
jgi:release factor glutamine methyltransferase